MEKYGAVAEEVRKSLNKDSSKDASCDEFMPKPATSPQGATTCGQCAQHENTTNTRSPLCPHQNGRSATGTRGSEHMRR